MKLEKSVIAAIIALIVIAGVITGLYINEILEKPEIEKGDFVEINYIGYFENGTIFDTTYYDIALEANETYGLPLKGNESFYAPLNFTVGKGEVIQGLDEAILEMKKGEIKNVTIPPEKAYGIPLEINSTFNSSMLTQGIFVQELSVINLTGENITLKWEANKGQNLTYYPWWENISEITDLNETTVWITTTPEIGDYTYQSITITVENVTEEKIYIFIPTSGDHTVVNRIIPFPRIFERVPLYYFGQDLKNEGYSSHELAGKTLFFKVQIVAIYKVD